MGYTGELKAAEVLSLTDGIEVSSGAIVSKTLRKSENTNLTLFAFDAGQGLSGHSSPMDAYVQIVHGKMNITIGEDTHLLHEGECILMPAQVDHALEALEPSKMLLTMVKI